MTRQGFCQTSKDIFKVTLLALVEGLQVLIAVAVVMSQIPRDPSKVLEIFLEKYKGGYISDWEIEIYRSWIVATILIVLGMIVIHQVRNINYSQRRDYWRYLGVTGFLSGVQIIVGIFALMDKTNAFILFGLYILLLLAGLVRIFWKPIDLVICKISIIFHQWRDHLDKYHWVISILYSLISFLGLFLIIHVGIILNSNSSLLTVIHQDRYWLVISAVLLPMVYCLYINNIFHRRLFFQENLKQTFLASTISFQVIVGMSLLISQSQLMELNGYLWWGIILVILMVLFNVDAVRKHIHLKEGFVLRELFLTTCIATALWKLVLYQQREFLVYQILIKLIILAVVHKFTYGLDDFIHVHFSQRLIQWRYSKICTALIDVAVLFGIYSIVDIVDPLSVVAKMAFGEHFYHYDICLMAGAYASALGNILGVDQIAMYGLGMPIMIGWLAKSIFREATYFSTFIVYVSLCMGYFLIFYLCLRYWTKSILISVAAILLAIKWQLFYTMSYPMPFIYPNGSVLRAWWDIGVMVSLVAHLKTGQRRYCWLAGGLVGLSMFHMPTTGVDLMVAYMVYVLIFAMTQTLGNYHRGSFVWYRKIVLLGAMPLITAFLLIYWACGESVLKITFWKDLVEYPYLYVIGLYKMEFWRNLYVAGYWNFMIGCFIPLIYLFTMIFYGLRVFYQPSRKVELILVVVSAYGLSMFHHFVSMGVSNNYYMRAIPLVFVLTHWGWYLIKNKTPQQALKWKIAVSVLSIYALITNHAFLAYPNRLNISANPMVDPLVASPLPEDGRPYFFHKDYILPEYKLPANNLGHTNEFQFSEWQVADHSTLKSAYQYLFNFSKDAAMIQALTTPHEKVALISSFEIEFLIQSQRKPYFFQFPLIESRGLATRSFPLSVILSKSALLRVLKEVENGPPYIFMEKVFLFRELPAFYYQRHEELMVLLNAVFQYYEPYQQGEYLVTLKRKQIE